ncbi:MAG: hypothetical protein EA381_06905 [Planctomycetaceae bacterium]|nr:MAG: hypothetical protein EA381_06905 [Planctomycetaceae bacterium]
MVLLSVSLIQIAGPLALAISIAHATSPFGWTRQIGRPLALKIGRSMIGDVLRFPVRRKMP